MTSPAPASDPIRVLVVDDEPNIVDVISMALRFQGFVVDTAATGDEALAAVASFRPQLIVLDIMLPDMEGFEVAERLGADRGQIPIIFLTGYGDIPSTVRAMKSGALEFFTKPFDDEAFDGCVCTVSVQYLTSPVEVFAEVRRVLGIGSARPFVVSFSNRCFPTKAVAIWRYGSDADHVDLVRTYFASSGFDGVQAVRLPSPDDPVFVVTGSA